ncbi:MAG: hypothetical protein WCE79_03400 [Xanthobacteraceae bacterium]
MRSLIAILAAAFIGLAFASDSASARPGGGGFRGGGGFYAGGFHGGGFRPGWGGGFRHHGFRPGFPLVGAAVGLGLAASYPYWGGYPAYYGDGCLVRQRIWTPYGWRVRVVDACY